MFIKKNRINVLLKRSNGMDKICICAQSQCKLSVYGLDIHPSNKEEI